ncbi:uncharacterized protein SCHCODRAFT_02462991, partial [Schizophyllum commune H4-8]|uniref:uncharacterized protein n=1 Tax=Schizophyllum commune (strain H4-8 / FGSC 9210) TaxID=578458 RepID=UPI00215DDACA
SRRPSMQKPKDNPVARPRSTQTPARTKPWGRTAYGFTYWSASTASIASSGLERGRRPALGRNQAAARARHLTASLNLGAGRRRARSDG